MLLYLIGLPGVGKTTVGKQIAKKLQFSFLDLDDEIEKSIGNSIPQIFKIEGEDYFRKIEKQELHKTFTLQNIIVATGGGTPCFFDNMRLMKRAGKTIYLKAEPEAVIKKISIEEIKNRPIFNNIEDLNNLYLKRKPVYEEADFIIDTHNINLVDSIISML